MKILVCCKHGNNRSSCIGLLLKKAGHDVLNIGLDKNSLETRDMLSKWADKIIVVQEYMLDQIWPQYREKTVVLELGEDIWGRSFHPDMMKKVRKLVGELVL